MLEGIKNLVSYSKILREKGMNFEVSKVITFLPDLTESDYTKGYIERYFIQKTNDTNSPIIEISKQTVASIEAGSYYTFCKIIWKIKGTQEEIKTANKKSISTVKNELPNLYLYLPNLLQFAKVN